MKRNQTARPRDEANERWVYHGIPAVRDLLDHVARELAEEYVRLLRDKTGEARDDGSGSDRKE